MYKKLAKSKLPSRLIRGLAACTNKLSQLEVQGEK